MLRGCDLAELHPRCGSTMFRGVFLGPLLGDSEHPLTHVLADPLPVRCGMAIHCGSDFLESGECCVVHLSLPFVVSPRVSRVACEKSRLGIGHGQAEIVTISAGF